MTPHRQAKAFNLVSKMLDGQFINFAELGAVVAIGRSGYGDSFADPIKAEAPWLTDELLEHTRLLAVGLADAQRTGMTREAAAAKLRREPPFREAFNHLCNAFLEELELLMAEAKGTLQ